MSIYLDGQDNQFQHNITKNILTSLLLLLCPMYITNIVLLEIGSNLSRQHVHGVIVALQQFPVILHKSSNSIYYFTQKHPSHKAKYSTPLSETNSHIHQAYHLSSVSHSKCKQFHSLTQRILTNLIKTAHNQSRVRLYK